jgi:hypothetical protein
MLLIFLLKHSNITKIISFLDLRTSILNTYYFFIALKIPERDRKMNRLRLILNI